MHQYPDAIIALNHLLARNRDSQKGFVEISAKISYPQLVNWLIDNSVKREKFVEDLTYEIAHLGGEATEDGTLFGVLHRFWIDLKGQWTNHDTYTMLSECERGEERAFEDYEHIIKFYKMPSRTLILLKAHRDEIQFALESIRALKKMLVPENI